MSYRSQSGNVLFLILIVVALFAALSYVVIGHTGRTSQGAGDEAVGLQASEILNYATSISAATQRVITLGQADRTTVSFQNLLDTDYDNSNCTQNICQVFNSQGGLAVLLPPPDGANDGSAWIYTFDNQVPAIGLSVGGAPTAAELDLVMILSNLTVTLCEELNDRLHGSRTIPQEVDSFGTSKHDGATFGNETLSVIGGAFDGEYSGCIEGNTSPAAGTYHFYHVVFPQ